MKIDLKGMEYTENKSFLGGEKSLFAKIYNDGTNKILYGKLEPGASIGFHKHDAGSEIIYVLSGSGKVLYDDTEEPLSEGDCHYCPKNHSHSLVNSGTRDLVFFAVVPRQ